jgi:hypothetical protein
VWAKELAEGVCEIVVLKGVMGERREVEEVEEGKEAKDRGDLRFITGCPAREEAWGGIRAKTWRHEEEPLLVLTRYRVPELEGCCQENNKCLA